MHTLQLASLLVKYSVEERPFLGHSVCEGGRRAEGSWWHVRVSGTAGESEWPSGSQCFCVWRGMCWAHDVPSLIAFWVLACCCCKQCSPRMPFQRHCMCCSKRWSQSCCALSDLLAGYWPAAVSSSPFQRCVLRMPFQGHNVLRQKSGRGCRASSTFLDLLAGYWPAAVSSSPFIECTTYAFPGAECCGGEVRVF